MFSNKGPDCAHLLLCRLGWRASLHTFPGKQCILLSSPGSPTAARCGLQRALCGAGPAGGGRQVGGAHPSPHPPPPPCPQLPQAAPGAQGPDSRSRPRVGGAGQWAAQAPRGRRSRSGTGPEGISAPGATVWTGSQVFPTQRTGCGPQRGPRTLTCTSCQNKNKFKRDLTHEKALKAQRHISNQRKHDSGKKRGTNWALWELRASVCLRPQGGSPAQAGGMCDTRSEEQPEPVGTLVAHPGVFPAHSEGPVS